MGTPYNMEFDEKYITYKDRIVFIKLSMPFFNRKLKEYVDDEACFMFVNKGEVGIRAPEEYLRLNKDTAMIAKCLNYFFEPTSDTEKCKDGVEAVGVFLYPNILEELFEFDLNASSHSLDYNVQQVQVDRLLDNYRNSIDILLETPEMAGEGMVKTKLKEFVQLVYRSQNAPSQLDFLSGLFRQNDLDFKKVIQENLYVNLSVEELSQLAHLSVSSFKRKFKETFSESPKKYITRKKIEKAAELLKISDERVSNIAYDVGFESVGTFNRNFITFYGKSPSEFRVD